MFLDKTLEFYNNNPEVYFDRTFLLDLPEFYPWFTEKIAAGGNILDLGASSGRDSIHFIKQGFNVTAVDGSVNLAQLVTTKLGLPVQVKRFNEIDYVRSFDGVWASCSILHLGFDALTDVYLRVSRSLKVGGYFYASFKEGKDSFIDSEGRYFYLMNEDSLLELAKNTGFKTLQIKVKKSMVADQPNTFIHWLGIKTERKGKLVRDKVPSVILANEGATPVIETLRGSELKDAMLLKVLEEAEEVKASPCLEEIADCMEVLHALARELGFSSADLKKARIKKNKERGAFAEGVFLYKPE